LDILRNKKTEEGNDDLDDGLLRQEVKEGQDKWEENKENKETLAVFNYRQRSNKYLQAVVTTATAQNDFQDKQHELGVAQLSDPSKIPREVLSELYEASQVSKISTQKQPDFEFKDKTGITSCEILAYAKAVVNECCMLTFGAEKSRLSKLISKLHRMMLVTISSYQQRCQLQVPDINQETDPSVARYGDYAPKGQMLCHWMDFAGQKSSLFYILGPFDTEATKDRFPAGEEEGEEQTQEDRKRKAEEALENAIVHFGKVEVEDLTLSQLYQDTRDLIDKMRESETFSSERNERDRKGYRDTYHSLILRLGNLFKPPILSEEDLERDIDCLALVKELLPELSIAAVEQLA
jgi:hypothetical protein